MENKKQINRLTNIKLTKEEYNKKIDSLATKLYTTYLLADIIDSYYVDLLSGLNHIGCEMKFETKFIYNKLLANIKQSRALLKQLTDSTYKEAGLSEHFVATSDDLTDLISAFLVKTGNDRKRVEMVMKSINRYKDVV